MTNQSKKKGLFEKLIDFLAKIFSIKQIKKKKKNLKLMIFIQCGKN